MGTPPTAEVINQFQQYRQSQAEELKDRLAKLTKLRDEIDVAIAEARRMLAAVDPQKTRTATGRLTREEAHRRRQEAGHLIYKWLERFNHPQGRKEIEAVIPAEMRYHFLKIIQQWNHENPRTPIRSEGRARNQIRYYVHRPLASH